MTSQKNQLSVTDNVSLSARRKINAICHRTTILCDCLTMSHFFMKERMVALDGEYSAGERIEKTSNLKEHDDKLEGQIKKELEEDLVTKDINKGDEGEMVVRKIVVDGKVSVG
ncbi:hypothetical protein GYH30_010432 [Glycine max]|nr:hypothetical protein GYH30_010432 [Glycine max]